MRDAAVAAVVSESTGRYVDCTFGRGGHTQALLGRIGANGRVLALDRDPDAVSVGQALAGDDSRLTMVHARFGSLQEQVRAWEAYGEVDGILFDLGLSSPQLDSPERGFSFISDGPLDMRMDPSAGVSAAQWLADASVEQIARVLRDYGEERFARRIAQAIERARVDENIDSTARLAALVASALPAAVRRKSVKHPATRVFQALRIQVNAELSELESALPQARSCLRIGGRLAVISFHSLEDRIVKRSLRGDANQAMPRGLPITGTPPSRTPWRAIGKAQRPTTEEIACNPRARSAVLRVAERRH